MKHGRQQLIGSGMKLEVTVLSILVVVAGRTLFRVSEVNPRRTPIPSSQQPKTETSLAPELNPFC